jgi:hypothetical protein
LKRYYDEVLAPLKMHDDVAQERLVFTGHLRLCMMTSAISSDSAQPVLSRDPHLTPQTRHVRLSRVRISANLTRFTFLHQTLFSVGASRS